MSEKQVLALLIEIEGLQRRLSAWKKTPGNLMREENKLYQKLKEFIKSKTKEIMEQLKAGGRVPSSDMELRILLQPLQEAKEEYNDIIMENTREAIRSGMERTISELKKQGLGKSKAQDMLYFLNGSIKSPYGSLDFNEFSEEISKLLEEQTFIASEQTINRMTGNVMDNLRESYEQGLGIDSASRSLNDVFDDMQGYELERVARTEINGAQNRGAEATEMELGVQYDRWRTAGDGRVRGTRPEDTADHTYLNGQISKVGGRFSNGLTRPGDRNGRIAEWINCRCALIPYLMPEGYIAPAMEYFYDTDLIKVEEVKPVEEVGKPTEKPQRTSRDIRSEISEIDKETKARQELLRSKRTDINFEWKRHYDSKPMYNTPEWKIWEKEGRDIISRKDKIINDLKEIRDNINSKCREKIYASEKGYKIDPHIGKGFDDKTVATTQKATKEFSKLVDEKMWPEDTGIFVKKLKEGGRAYQDGQRIYITNTDDVNVIIHEMGHFLEEHSPGVHKKVQAFYNMRTSGEEAVRLAGYDADELFKIDKFMDKYMGKVYSDGTEILSQGLQIFYDDPIRLATKDPEMFDFIFDLVRGAK